MLGILNAVLTFSFYENWNKVWISKVCVYAEISTWAHGGGLGLENPCPISYCLEKGMRASALSTEYVKCSKVSAAFSAGHQKQTITPARARKVGKREQVEKRRSHEETFFAVCERQVRRGHIAETTFISGFHVLRVSCILDCPGSSWCFERILWFVIDTTVYRKDCQSIIGASWHQGDLSLVESCVSWNYLYNKRL